MEVLHITTENFESEVMKSEEPVLLDFWASWCGPCRMLAPTIEEIAAEVSNIKVGKINVDEEQELAEKYGVMSIPTVLVIKNGQEVSRSVGVKPKSALLKMLEA